MERPRVCPVLCSLEHLLNYFTRCHLYIWADGMDSIHLQVEMDVLSMSYTNPEDEGGFACMIFKVCLNRHTTWANNHSQS